MEIFGHDLVALARRRAYRDVVEACGGDKELADDLIEGFAGGNPSLSDLRQIAAHARDVAAEIEAEDE